MVKNILGTQRACKDGRSTVENKRKIAKASGASPLDPTTASPYYTSPCYHSSPENNLRMFECFRKVDSKRVIILGDFNFSDIDWQLCTSGPHGNFLDVVSDCFFSPSMYCFLLVAIIVLI